MVKFKRILTVCLAFLLFFSFSLSPPASALVIADDVTIFGIVSLLSSWGLSFAAEGASQADITDQFNQMIADAGISLANLTTGSVTLPSSGIFKLAPAAVSVAHQLADYVIGSTGADGTHDYVTPTAGGRGYYATDGSFISFGLADLSITPAQAAFGWSSAVITYDMCYYGFDWRDSRGYGFYAKDRSTTYDYGQSCPFSLYYPKAGSTSPSTKTISVGTDYFKLVSIADSSANTILLPSSNSTNWYGSGSVDVNPVFFTADAPASDFSFSASASGAAVPDEVPTRDQYVTAPGLSYGNTDAVGDYWTDAITGAVPYPATKSLTSVADAAGVRDETGTDNIPADIDSVSGLPEVFPFCIPFDVYNILTAFVATREAPYIDIPLSFPEAIGGTQHIIIDFEQFDTVAQIARTMEFIVAALGLAAATRKFIKW